MELVVVWGIAEERGAEPRCLGSTVSGREGVMLLEQCVLTL